MGWRGVLDFRLLLLNVGGLLMVQSMSDVWVELRGPRFVVHRSSVTLRCDHNVDPEAVYKVVFYKYEQKIVKYVRGREPPYEIYNFTGANLLVDESRLPTSIILENMDFTATGPYACEIALDTPLYSKMSKYHEVNVIVRQKHRPRIKIKHKKLPASEKLEATCQSAAAYPAPHLSWFINNVKVEEHLTIPHGTANSRHHHGIFLSITSSSLRFPLDTLQLQPNQTVQITCLSTIPGYVNEYEGFADVQNNTVSANVIQLEPTPTQLPVKIISPEMNISYRCPTNIALIVLSLVCHYSF